MEINAETVMANDPSQDQDFLAAAPHEQHAYLMATDADYAKASPQDQVAYLSHVSPKLSQTQFEKDRTPQGSAISRGAKAFGTGLLNAASGVADAFGEGLSGGPNPKSIAESAANISLADQQRKEEGRSGAYRGLALGASAVGVDPTGMEEASRHGDTAGVVGSGLGQAAVATAPLAGEAIGKGIGAARRGIGKSMYTPEGELTPIAHAITHPTKIPEMAARKVFPEPAEQVAVRKGEATAAELESRMTEVEKARQKELSDNGRMTREEARQHEKFAGSVEKTEAARQKELAANERLKTMHGNDLMRRGAEQEGLDARTARAAQEEESIGTKIFPEPRNPLPGDKPGAMWSVGREDVLPEAAQRGAPGAGDVLRNIGKPIIYTPREGVGYPGPRPEPIAEPAAQPTAPNEAVGELLPMPERRMNVGVPPEGTSERRSFYDRHKANVGPTPGEQLEQEIRGNGNKPSKFSEGEVRQYIAQDAKRYAEFRNADRKTQDAMIVKASREMEKR